ncbi:hypothetical protein N6H14_28220 [Paenibacillus sp. CC-CFT747]|nr:hypothetical protein N6H14_28220 [Paenibacillus sp. CC-CFT747]
MKPARTLFVRLLWSLLSVLLVIGSVPEEAYADYPYSTNYRNKSGGLVWTQAAYAPERVLGQDIFIPDPKTRERLSGRLFNSPAIYSWMPRTASTWRTRGTTASSCLTAEEISTG